ncbi:hypothetical protein C8J57DRAFT_1649127 [Mycena rebaudengoi]|nr:hypothetical protein C8J57DRAFT_1649127 [Mycena rebaudengoi]
MHASPPSLPRHDSYARDSERDGPLPSVGPVTRFMRSPFSTRPQTSHGSASIVIFPRSCAHHACNILSANQHPAHRPLRSRDSYPERARFLRARRPSCQELAFASVPLLALAYCAHTDAGHRRAESCRQPLLPSQLTSAYGAIGSDAVALRVLESAGGWGGWRRRWMAGWVHGIVVDAAHLGRGVDAGLHFIFNMASHRMPSFISAYLGLYLGTHAGTYRFGGEMDRIATLLKPDGNQENILV